MTYKQRSSPFQRNFGVNSPAKAKAGPEVEGFDVDKDIDTNAPEVDPTVPAPTKLFKKRKARRAARYEKYGTKSKRKARKLDTNKERFLSQFKAVDTSNNVTKDE